MSISSVNTDIGPVYTAPAAAINGSMLTKVKAYFVNVEQRRTSGYDAIITALSGDSDRAIRELYEGPQRPAQVLNIGEDSSFLKRAGYVCVVKPFFIAILFVGGIFGIGVHLAKALVGREVKKNAYEAASRSIIITRMAISAFPVLGDVALAGIDNLCIMVRDGAGKVKALWDARKPADSASAAKTQA